MNQVESRKDFFKRCAYTLSSFFCIELVIKGCNTGEVKPADKNEIKQGQCDDLSGLSENDLLTRKKFNYVEVAALKSKSCHLCNLYIPAQSNSSCGGCMLFKGPVQSGGSCTYWAPKSGNSDS